MFFLPTRWSEIRKMDYNWPPEILAILNLYAAARDHRKIEESLVDERKNISMATAGDNKIVGSRSDI
jgi:hypothetical protein